jgi:hypothetical protein
VGNLVSRVDRPAHVAADALGTTADRRDDSNLPTGFSRRDLPRNRSEPSLIELEVLRDEGSPVVEDRYAVEPGAGS